ncbi:uncharacterized protein F4812DRAFT_160497 [Daldinia caldariorum]|uniref:uncharacterized protein n=1 Tax=Daldinia caldariorum TaxID=326644 RepID=UPI0020085FAA|nr:uncharacterized protein F4812DRAFT_160497 [Daldinia caldariorum]KAI1464589.1 hypothetical protein F4812DRAFT_160497 [Daldinia caldariorum]
MSTSRNRDIRGFFGKAAGRSNDPQSQSASSSEPVRDPQLSFSSPTTPRKPTPKLRDRTDEIKGSDDEDGDSDDSLESISAFIQRKNGPSPYQRDSNLTSTPRAKRIASNSSSLLKSPLTLQPKHKFDLKSLINHARQSDRADESARRADELINQSEDDDDNDQILTDVQNDPTLLQKTAKELLKDDEEDTKGDKLMRAMNRTKIDASRRLCYFFSLEPPLFKPPRSPFPEKGAKGCWRCLANSRTRDQAVILGLPHAIASKGKALPDELFLWILDEVCAERNVQLRIQYCNLVTLCPDSIARLVTEKRLYSMLERMDGPKSPQSQNITKLESFPRVEDPYPGRDWSGLVTFLELLKRMAPNLKSQNAIGAIKLLVRMGLDPLVSTTVRSEHSAAMEALVTRLSKWDASQWDEVCETISSYLYQSVDDPMHQVVPISYMPKTTAKLLDLRRRMAAVMLFRDTALSSRPVDESLTLAKVMDRLDSDDFRVRPTTDFESLRALVALLDIAIGDAGFIMQQHSGNNEGEEDAARKFDKDIDALTFRLKVVHDKIHDSTLLSRKVTKASIDLVAKRLTYAVRTRPPPKTSIFDPEPREDANIPKQRAFMKNWAQKKAERNNTAATAAN